MNWKRILVGGLLAGVVINVLDMVANVLILGDRYMSYQAKGIFLKESAIPFFTPLWILGMFAMGLCVAWLYAAVRSKLGPGPKTALLLGIVLSLMIYVPSNFSMAAWGIQGRFVPLVWMVAGFVEIILATLTAGLFYKE